MNILVCGTKIVKGPADTKPRRTIPKRPMSEAAQHLCHEVVDFAYPRNLIRVQKSNSGKKKKEVKRTIPVPCSSTDFKRTRDRAVNVPLPEIPSREVKISTYKYKVPTYEKKTSYTRVINTGVNTLSTGPLKSENKSVTSFRNKEPSRDLKVREKYGPNRTWTAAKCNKSPTLIAKEVYTDTDVKNFLQDKATTACASTINQGTNPCPNTQDSEIQVKVANRNKSTIIMTQQHVRRNRSMILPHHKSSTNLRKMGARRWALGYSDRRKGADF